MEPWPKGVLEARCGHGCIPFMEVSYSLKELSLQENRGGDGTVNMCRVPENLTLVLLYKHK